MIALAESWQPKITNNLPKKIIQEAKQYYSYRYEDFNGLTRNGLVSYIRHEYTDYESYLARLPEYKGQSGNGFLYFILRDKVDELLQGKFASLLATLSQ